MSFPCWQKNAGHFISLLRTIADAKLWVPAMQSVRRDPLFGVCSVARIEPFSRLLNPPASFRGGLFEIIECLQVHPSLSAHTQGTLQPHCGFGCDSSPTPND